MFTCSLCKLKTNYPSEWKRHINLTKHQKIVKKNKELAKEEHDKNTNLLLGLKRNKVIVKIIRLNAQLLELKEELEGLTLEGIDLEALD
jgi:hypothetical protein